MEEITVESIVQGVKIYHISTCESTQNLVKVLISPSSPQGQNLCVYTFLQTKGVGQLTNTWSSEPDKNLLFTCAFELNDSIVDLVKLNKAISGAALTLLGDFVTETVKVKWPNDLILKDKKLGGLLMEVQNFENKRYIIIGLGINFLQNYWLDPSIRGIGMSNYLKSELSLSEFKSIFLPLFLKSMVQILGDEQSLKFYLNQYNTNLYKLNEPISFKKDNEIHIAVLNGVDQFGRVELKNNKSIESFHHGEVRLLL